MTKTNNNLRDENFLERHKVGWVGKDELEGWIGSKHILKKILPNSEYRDNVTYCVVLYSC